MNIAHMRAQKTITEAKEKGLTKLDISTDRYFNSYAPKLTEIPIDVFGLHQLEELNLSGHALKSVPEAITKLPKLTSLNLAGNQISTLPEAITKLLRLTSLNLAGNQLVAMPEVVSKLQSLTSLNLEGNQFSAMPTEIVKLPQLTSLDLSNNQLTTLPEVATELQGLTSLSLAGNQLTVLPDVITKLENLTTLDLSDNQLTSLPDAITKLPNLTTLIIGANQFTTLPDAVCGIGSLRVLSLRGSNPSKTQFKELSSKILQLEHLEILDLTATFIVHPPAEIARRGLPAIKNYFRQLEADGADHLYEAKLLILGEGGAGKTTFANKIVNPNFQLSDQEKSTEGIAVTKWNFPMRNGKLFRVNIWDFGGQEIYHATHQFFLTKRSLYALVADSREENTNFYYWLNIVELLSDNSPLLIVQNEKQDRRREINDGQLREQFSNLEKTLRTNLSDNRGLSDVLNEVKFRLLHLPQIGVLLPKTWVNVREALEGENRNYIEIDEYFSICQENGFKSERNKLQLSGYLHDLGVCLHFQDDPLLYRKVILKPKWGTDAVYRVLDNTMVLDNLGKFTKQDLEMIWNEPEYIGMQNELLQLMINFKLCYKVPNSQSYIAPQLLRDQKPEYDWDTNNNLILRYTYMFMPKGIITQLIVAMNREIAAEDRIWKSGVILMKDNTLAEVVEYYDKREIRIRVSGKHKRDLMMLVAYELDKIHYTYPRLKYNKLIPCNCEKCQDVQEPHFHQLETLRQFLSDHQEEIQCPKSYTMVEVRGLVDEVLDRKQLAVEMGPGHSSERAMLGTAFYGAVDKVIIQPIGNEGNIMKEKSVTKSGDAPLVKSPWASGSFYLCTGALVVAGLGVLSKTVSIYSLPIILIASVILIPIIGGLQLKQDGRLSDKSFVELMKIAIGQLPLIAKLFKPKQPKK